MDPTSHRVTGSHDNALHVLEWSTEGVPMVLLHGHGNEAHLWDDFVPAVAEHYRVLAVDQRGHGDSDWDPEARYHPEDMCDDLERILDHFGIDRFVLIGFSMGGRVSTVFAGRHPVRLAGLVLVDIGPELDARCTSRIGKEMSEQRAPVFTGVDEYARMLSLNYPACVGRNMDEIVRCVAALQLSYEKSIATPAKCAARRSNATKTPKMPPRD